jgi:hypothetical protein
MANKLITTLKDNKTVITKKVLVYGGAALGVFAAAVLLNNIRPNGDVLVVSEGAE